MNHGVPDYRGIEFRPAPEAKRFRYLRIAVVLLFTGVMAFLALRRSPYLQYLPWMPRRIGVWADHNGVWRNTVAFFGFAAVVFALLGPRLTWVIALCGFGTAIEVAQIWIPVRSFDWRDIAATIAGVLIAWPVAWCIRRWTRAR